MRYGFNYMVYMHIEIDGQEMGFDSGGCAIAVMQSEYRTCFGGVRAEKVLI